MNDGDNLLTMMLDQASRLFDDLIDRPLLSSAERGVPPTALIEAVDRFGLADALTMLPDEGGLSYRQAAALFALFGFHIVPLPLGETMLARAVLARAGLDAPGGWIALADAATGDTLLHTLLADHVVELRDGAIRLLKTGDAVRHPHCSIARDGCTAASVADVIVVADAPWPQSMPPAATLGAMLRASQIAGATARVLALSIDYANTRQQFGRPIGRFQAVQQLLARLAAESAAAQSAADSAWEALDTGTLGFAPAVAKIRCGEAARVAAAIAHQVHGAIGVTDEHLLHYFTRRLWNWRLDFGSDVAWARALGADIRRSPDDLWTILTRRGDGPIPAKATA